MTPDEKVLDYWGDRFVAAGLAEVLSFEQFMEMAPALRERRIAHMDVARHVQWRTERALPDAVLHGHRLIDPMQHGKRPFRRRWFHTLRNHFRRGHVIQS